jgi:RNA polymerase sigma factor (sigma-70 family)
MKRRTVGSVRTACTPSRHVVSFRDRGRPNLSALDAMSFGQAAEAISEIDDLYRQHRDAVQRYVLHAFGAGPPDPADVAHAAFERFIAIEHREEIANPRAFLIASARNYVLDQRRRFKVRNDYANDVRLGGDISDDFDPERVLLAKQQWQTLQRAIEELDPRRRDILMMNRMQGLSSAEIARRIGCSATLVKTLLAQALVVCQRVLRESES